MTLGFKKVFFKANMYFLNPPCLALQLTISVTMSERSDPWERAA